MYTLSIIIMVQCKAVIMTSYAAGYYSQQLTAQKVIIAIYPMTNCFINSIIL